MRRLLFSLLALPALLACSQEPRYQTAYRPPAQDTVFVRDSHTGENLLLLCAAGVICNRGSGTLIHAYPVGVTYPVYYSQRYAPSAPTFYTRQPAYRTRYTVRTPYDGTAARNARPAIRNASSPAYRSSSPLRAAPSGGYRSSSSPTFRSSSPARSTSRSSSGFRSSSSSGFRSSSRRP